MDLNSLAVEVLVEVLVTKAFVCLVLMHLATQRQQTLLSYMWAFAAVLALVKAVLVVAS